MSCPDIRWRPSRPSLFGRDWNSHRTPWDFLSNGRFSGFIYYLRSATAKCVLPLKNASVAQKLPTGLSDLTGYLDIGGLFAGG
jgi:hypothetical protein